MINDIYEAIAQIDQRISEVERSLERASYNFACAMVHGTVEELNRYEHQQQFLADELEDLISWRDELKQELEYFYPTKAS